MPNEIDIARYIAMVARLPGAVSTRLVAAAHADDATADDAGDDVETFVAPRRPAPVPYATDGLGHSAALVGLGAALPRDKRGPSIKRTAGCTSLYRQRSTSRATFSGC